MMKRTTTCMLVSAALLIVQGCSGGVLPGAAPHRRSRPEQPRPRNRRQRPRHVKSPSGA